MNTPTSDYEARGVSADKPGVHAAIKNLNKGIFPGAFCKVLPDLLCGDSNYCNIQHTDGAGTKANLGYLMAKLTEDNNYLRGSIRDSLFMNMDDVACVGAFGPILVSLIIDRNYRVVNDEMLAVLIDETQRVCDLLTSMGIECHFAGGETADIGDNTRNLTVNNAIIVRMKRVDVIDASKIRPGGVIVGFSSCGKATWETEPNSGIGANGLTDARHRLLCPDYRVYSETYSPETDQKLIYCGEFHLEDILPGDSRFTIAEALLSPTRTYMPLMKQICEVVAPRYIQAFIHCSGGGQTKIGKFGPPDVAFVKDNLFPLPPLFEVLRQAGNLSFRDVFKTYNAGHRLEGVFDNEFTANRCIQISKDCGIDAQIIGYVVHRIDNEPRVRIKNPEGKFEEYP